MEVEEDIRSSIFELYTNDFNFSGLLKSRWRIYHTSLLVKKGDDLKSMLQNIIYQIGRELQTKQLLDMRISLCPSMRFRETSPPSILMEVCLDKKIVYTGCFINFSSTPEPVDDFDSMPFLLTKGKVNLSKKITKILGTVLDFVMSPMRLNSLHLATMFLLFAGHTLKEENGLAKLKFAIPGLPAKDSINVKIVAKHLNPVVDYYYETRESIEEPLETYFYERVLEHLLRTYGIDLTKAELKEVVFPGASINTDGTICIKSEQTLLNSLAALHALFQKDRPSMAASTSFISD